MAQDSQNSRRLWLFPGSVRGFSRKTPGKSRENCWKIFPESRNATNSRIWGTGKGQPAGNLGSTLPGPRPHLPCGMFLKSTVPAFSSFSERCFHENLQAMRVGFVGGLGVACPVISLHTMGLFYTVSCYCSITITSFLG